jgi:predicted nucleic acid-binding protein
MVVVDASAAVNALLKAGPARQAVASEQVHVPHLIDPEVANGLRRMAQRGEVTERDAWTALAAWRRLGVVRYPVFTMFERMWQLRANVSAYDAAYVALAEALGCALLTSDGRLGRVPGITCPVTVLP